MPEKKESAALVVGLASCVMFILLSYHVLIDYTRNWDYNAVRLQRSFVLRAGETIYPGRDSGALLNTIYGPIGAVAYLPATVMRTPATAVLAGQALSLLFFFGPVVWLHLRRRGDLPARLAVLLFAAIAIDQRPLEYVAFSIHVDAPALALSLLAWGLVLGTGTGSPTRRDPVRADPVRSLFRDLGASACAVLAVWTKLMLLPLLAVLPLWVWWAAGRRRAARFAAHLLLVGMVLSAILLLVFGPAEDLLFNLWTVPSRHTLGPVLEPGRWIAALGRLWWENATIWALWLLVLIARLARSRTGWIREPVCAYAVLGLSLTPFSIMGYLKDGGDINAFSYTAFFILAGATLSLAREAREAVRARRLLAILPPLILAQTMVLQEPAWWRTWTEPLRLSEVPHQLAYEYARAHPGEMYFPRITLATLLAEGRVDHQVVGIMDRQVAGLPPSAEHLRSHLPPYLRGIAFAESGFSHEIDLIDLPEFRDRARIEELPGFVVYRRDFLDSGPRPGEDDGHGDSLPVGSSPGKKNTAYSPIVR